MERSDGVLRITKEEQKEEEEERMPKVLDRSSGHEEEDRISNLQDEVLISILSQLSAQVDIDQAARTSILSKRWRNLWRFSMNNLRFEFSSEDECLDEGSSDEDEGEDEWLQRMCDYRSWYECRCKEFVGRVNRVLELHLGDSIDDFHLLLSIVDFTRYGPDIDGWLNFALRKKVKRLSVGLVGSFFHKENNFFGLTNNYSLTPEVIFKGCQGVNTTLVSLRLSSVQVAGEFLEYVFSVCRSLEDLSVSSSYVLGDLTVSGPSLKLKHLEIYGCMLKRLHIHHVNTLVSFNYKERPGACVTIQETPCLVNSSMAYAKDNTVKILTQIPSLKMLQLDFKSTGNYVGDLVREFAPEFPQLKKLKQLKLVLYSRIVNHCSLCARLLEASPSLTELKIRFEFLKESDKEKEVKRLEHPHQHLKVVELHGFIGCQLDFGVALYIIGNTKSLEKMIVDTNQRYRWDWKGPEMGEAARTFVRQHLEPRLPSWTELVVR